MKFSIVIPNLNSAIISQTLAALLVQMDLEDDCEIIVVGLDERKLVQESFRVRFVDTGKPVSPAAARNIGTRIATGDIICFLDADCIPNKNWMKQISARFSDPALEVIGGGVDTKQFGFWSLSDHISNFHDYLVTAKPGNRDQLPSLNLMIRKSILLPEGFDETRPIGEDSDLTTRLRLSGHKLEFDPKISVIHFPERKTFSAICRQAWWHGYYSIKVDRRWQSRLHAPLILRHRVMLLITSPILALGVTVQLFLRDFSLVRYLYTAPTIFLLKMMWCWGATKGLGR